MKDFTYIEPLTLAEALDFLAEHGDESGILGGGCSLILLLKYGFVAPGYVVSLRKSPGLQSVTHEDGQPRIGAMVTHRVLELSDEIKAVQPAIPEMASCPIYPRLRRSQTQSMMRWAFGSRSFPCTRHGCSGP